MEKQGKLELTWVGKYEEEKLEPRIFIEDEQYSYGEYANSWRQFNCTRSITARIYR